MPRNAAPPYMELCSELPTCDNFLLSLQALGNAVVLGGIALVAFVTWREGNRALTFAANLLNNWCANPKAHSPHFIMSFVLLPAMPSSAVCSAVVVQQQVLATCLLWRICSAYSLRC